MSPRLPALLAFALAYLIGAIPFAYLTAYAVKGIDIRTVGSGNVGATNVGRVLGFRYFLLVFFLDFLKGFLPTMLLPMAVNRYLGAEVHDLSVQVALATILGHNFPIYLRFKGGKGVATSFGAILWLDPLASLATLAMFTVAVLSTRYVSLSSILGGVTFVAVHFAHQGHPWRRDHIAMSLFTIGVLVMLVYRHRGNIARLAAGTEPKVGMKGRPQAPPRSGRVATVVAAGLAALGAGGALAAWAARPATLDCGPFSLVATARVSTGHQRADHVAFADRGNLLAVTCPRYGRVVLYRVEGPGSLALVRDVAIEGRPVGLWAARDRIYVLQRPAGDARHVEEAWWEELDFRGERLGPKVRVGFDPDDMAVSADGRTAFVLTSGRAEGESNRPEPALLVFDLGPGRPTPRPIARLQFDRPGDDPARLTLSASGRHAAVTLLGTDQVAAIDLGDREHPRLLARSPLEKADLPRLSVSEFDSVLMPVATDREALCIDWPRPVPPARREADDGSTRYLPLGRYVVGALPRESALEVVEAAGERPLGRLPLRGAANLGGIRPSGLAYSPERALLAIANRQGGSVHLVAIRPNASWSVTRR